MVIGANKSAVKICGREHMAVIPKICVGDVLEMKKPHPCGEKHYTVLRVGSDVRIVCRGCGRDITMSREKLEKCIKKIKHPSSDGTDA